MGNTGQLLYAQGIGAPQTDPTAEKPMVAAAAVAAVAGVNLANANGTSNFDTKGIMGKDLFAAPDQGGHAILSLSSRPDSQRANFMQRGMLAAAGDLNIGKIKTDTSTSSGGGSGGGSGSGSTAPVSSGGGGGGGGTMASSSGGGSSFRGGDGDVSLSASIASLVGGANLQPMDVSAPVNLTPSELFVSTAPAEAPAVPAGPAGPSFG